MLWGAVFVPGRDEAAVRAEDLTGPGYELLRFFRQKVEQDNRRVTASFHGLGTPTPVFPAALGCTLIAGKTETDLRAEATDLSSAPPPSDPEALWPEGERVDTPAQDVDLPALDAGIEAAFAEPDPAHPRNTRALVVVHRGRMIAERYAPGFDARMPLIGWGAT